jgi:hypothetical protein
VGKTRLQNIVLGAIVIRVSVLVMVMAKAFGMGLLCSPLFPSHTGDGNTSWVEKSVCTDHKVGNIKKKTQ